MIVRYSMMMSCWKAEPSERPLFSSLVESLSKILENQADYLYVGAFTDPETMLRGQELWNEFSDNQTSVTHNNMF